jgi:hypothetical protein
MLPSNQKLHGGTVPVQGYARAKHHRVLLFTIANIGPIALSNQVPRK